MAAHTEPFSQMPFPKVKDLKDFRAHDLDDVLIAEEREWADTLDWDFGKSAELVRKFVELGNLSGAVLVTPAGVQGYAYYVFEDGKGLIGDLYVHPDYRMAAYEMLLMDEVLNQIAALGGVPRVEAQIMMLSGELERPAWHWNTYQIFRRAFLGLKLPPANAPDQRALPSEIAL